MSELQPLGRFATFSLSASSAVLYIREINFDTESTLFTRSEKSHETLKNAPESTGNMPTYGQSLIGAPVQFIYGSATTARDLTPDDSIIDSIEQKFFFNRYTIGGTISGASDIALMFAWAAQHRVLQDRFEAYQKKIGDKISYQLLTTLGSETFSYLTTTGLSLSGSTLGTLNNLLIRSFNVNPVKDIQGLPSGQKLLYEWNGTFDQLSIGSAASTT